MDYHTKLSDKRKWTDIIKQQGWKAFYKERNDNAASSKTEIKTIQLSSIR